MTRKIIAGVFILLLIVGGYFLYTKLNELSVVVPEYKAPPEQKVKLDQNWSDDQRHGFHYTPQGTRLLPYAWFMALEQPCFSIFGCEPFHEKTYLARFGFLEGDTDPKLNPDGLPVGFAQQDDFYDPESKGTSKVVGLTCAACHTGELYFDKYAVRVEGAPAMIEVAQFQKALGVALILTDKMPFRLKRFEKNVLGPNATPEQKKQLQSDLDSFISRAMFEKSATDKEKIYANAAGFARTDALTRIGNQVFAVDMRNAANFAPANAPVRYPQVWDASWFTWVQYNSSISDPLVRNIGEALGVRASAKLYGSDAKELGNSVHMEGLKTIEDLLSGPAPYQGLASPKWPAVFPPLSQEKVTKGAALYKQHCESCHQPPVNELVEDMKSAQPQHWWKNKQGKQFLVVKDVKMEYVGTDPHEAGDFMTRTADSGDLGKGRISAEDGLRLVTSGMAANFFDRKGFTPEQRIEWSGFRDPGDELVRAKAIYKARPLNGIWAVAPYLHNGSVPNLYALLSPQSERPDTFWVGSKQFDPVKVGYDTSELKGGYLFDVRNPGDSNRGHEFKDGPKGNGVIGPALSPEDRWAIIEYLKSL
ncbi:MAG TPA: di-heme-cytochrome C peroxidase [Candidatus Angelobacter sp.]|nr:di-heme-cytochrome C peroxidase [Candidatus Angelobacter sp.]